MKWVKEWFKDPGGLRKLLNTPIRANKIRDAKRRQQFIAKEIARRERALFALYYIPDDWPDSIRWERLARHLAGELFAGCRVIEKGQGGIRKVRRLQIEEQRIKLFQKYERYLKDYHIAHPYWTRNRVTAAKNFIEENRQACTEVRLTTARSFLKALNAARRKRKAPQKSAAPSGRVSKSRTHLPDAAPPKRQRRLTTAYRRTPQAQPRKGLTL
jgi:hypothetical protein